MERWIHHFFPLNYFFRCVGGARLNQTLHVLSSAAEFPFREEDPAALFVFSSGCSRSVVIFGGSLGSSSLVFLPLRKPWSSLCVCFYVSEYELSLSCFSALLIFGPAEVDIRRSGERGWSIVAALRDLGEIVCGNISSFFHFPSFSSH